MNQIPEKDKCCEVFDKYKDDEFMYQRFDEAVSKALVEYTGYPAFACGTGFGDWSNQLSGIGVIKSDFFADAGMVCVCRLTSKMLKHWKEEYGTQDFSGIAIFEASKDISVEFDVDKLTLLQKKEIELKKIWQNIKTLEMM